MLGQHLREMTFISVLITNSSEEPWFCLWNSPNAFSCRTVLTLCSFPLSLQAVCPVLFVWQSTNLWVQQSLRKASCREVRKHEKPDPRTVVHRANYSWAQQGWAERMLPFTVHPVDHVLGQKTPDMHSQETVWHTARWAEWFKAVPQAGEMLA